jgi:hypothetical protein
VSPSSLPQAILAIPAHACARERLRTHSRLACSLTKPHSRSSPFFPPRRSSGPSGTAGPPRTCCSARRRSPTRRRPRCRSRSRMRPRRLSRPALPPSFPSSQTPTSRSIRARASTSSPALAPPPALALPRVPRAMPRLRPCTRSFFPAPRSARASTGAIARAASRCSRLRACVRHSLHGLQKTLSFAAVAT